MITVNLFVCLYNTYKLVINILVKTLQRNMQQVQKEKCLPLIYMDQNKCYRIDPASIQYLNTLQENDDYAVLSIVGKSKTGKSFLLNNLVGDRDMFPINSSIINSAQGIMISTKLVQVNGIKIIVLDSEGFGSLEGSDDRDCKFFILNLLLSSVILYNSMGTIDQQTLNSFSMIVQVGKLFEKQLQNSNSIPALFWVLRDFSLKMEDKHGSPITPKQYLQSALQQQKGNTQSICHKNRVRRVIKSLFTQRNCQTMVIPTEEIPTSINTSSIELRQEFVEDFARMKNKLANIIQRKGCKYFNGKRMSISLFINAIQIYVKCLNKSIMEGSMPKIENITFQLRQSQAKGCKDKFHTYLNQKKRDIMQQISELLKSKDKIEDIEHIKNKFLQPVQKFYETTRNNIYQLTGQLQLEELFEIKTNFYQELQKQCSQYIKRCQETCIDEHETDNYCEFLSHICDEQQLDQEYAVFIKNSKDKNIGKDRTSFANILMKIQLAYLRRKLQLSKQINLRCEKLTLELEFTKKELHSVQARNKELQNELISQIKESRKDYLTPNKQQYTKQKATTKSIKKQPGLIRKISESNYKEKKSNQNHNVSSSSKIQSSSFYIPYVLIQKSDYLSTKIVRTLIKEDNKRNNYIQYVIDINLLGQKWTVNRKFKDFSQLHSILVMMFQSVNLPDCKAITGPLTPADFNANKKQIVEQRRRQLENYIHELIQIQNIRNSRIMQKFLKINKEYTVM